MEEEEGLDPGDPDIQVEVVERTAEGFEKFVEACRDRVTALYKSDNQDLVKAEMLMCARDYGNKVGEAVEKAHGK